MFLEKSAKPDSIKEALWWEEMCVRREGGYDLDTANLPDDAKWLPKGVVLRFDKATGKANVLKSARVTEKASEGATTIKIECGSYFKVGDTVAGGAVSAVTRGESYDALTVSATTEELNVNDIVDDYSDTDVVLGLQYETLPIDKAAYMHVTPTLVVREVDENSLMYPVSDKVKTALNAVGTVQFKIQ